MLLVLLVLLTPVPWRRCHATSSRGCSGGNRKRTWIMRRRGLSRRWTCLGYCTALHNGCLTLHPDCRKALEREWLSHVRGFQEQQRDDLLAPAKKRRRLELAEEEELEEEDQETCYVCYGVEKDVGTLVHVLPCGHSGACLGCLRRLLGVGAKCPQCRAGFTEANLTPILLD